MEQKGENQITGTKTPEAGVSQMSAAEMPEDKAQRAENLVRLAEEKEVAEAKKRLARKAAKSQRRIRARSHSTIFSRLLTTMGKFGGKKKAIIDPSAKDLTYMDLTRASFALGSAIAKKTARGENVGVLLPTSTGAIVTFFALQSIARVPTMLNFTAGPRNLLSALKTAQVKTILTARKFIEVGELQGLVDALSQEANFIYLEDIKEQLSGLDKLRAALGPYLPQLFYWPPKSTNPAVILFTSGTEGTPKGVVLSHQNILANVEQVIAHVELEPSDIFFNPLPVFHSFGITGGTLYPLFDGHPVVPYPSPLHVKLIPELVRKTKATILFATDTFLHRYMKTAKPGALSSVRYAVCGAERVRDETRSLAKSQFGFNVLEGYGVTETAPVIAVNQPGDIRAGTVGKMLPGIETRLEPVEGLQNGGRLFIRGPNVMCGYLMAEKPGEIQVPPDGWHDTGDIVDIDGGGYMSIRGRLKRFAKLGGEMVSLSVVENCAAVVWPEFLHAAVAVPDDKKGEQIILLTENPEPDRSTLLHWAQNHGVPELAVPRKFLTVEDIPVLGTGKVDYVALQKLANEELEKEKK